MSTRKAPSKAMHQIIEELKQGIKLVHGSRTGITAVVTTSRIKSTEELMREASLMIECLRDMCEGARFEFQSKYPVEHFGDDFSTDLDHLIYGEGYAK